MLAPMASWSCPRCGAKLVGKNGAHACGPYSVARFLEGATARGRDLFARFERMIAACGAYDVAPAKTRVAFMAQTRFASVNKVRADAIDVHFVLPWALRSARLLRVDTVGDVFVHHLRLAHDDDFDDELLGWLRASYAEYGERRRLARRR
jgi:hypothetical protein